MSEESYRLGVGIEGALLLHFQLGLGWAAGCEVSVMFLQGGFLSCLVALGSTGRHFKVTMKAFA